MHPSFRFDISVQDAVVVQKTEAMEALHIPRTQVLPTSAPRSRDYGDGGWDDSAAFFKVNLTLD